jgi:ATP/maltotriose-dependent transcriptional regulator MalT
MEDGVMAYALMERDRRVPPEKLPAPELPDGGATLDDPLSEREMEVLALLSSGRTNAEVAKDLFVATGTVKAHVNNIYRKLDARNRAEALAKARDLRLLP